MERCKPSVRIRGARVNAKPGDESVGVREDLSCLDWKNSCSNNQAPRTCARLSLRLPGADLLRSLILGGFVNNTQTCGLCGGCTDGGGRDGGACKAGGDAAGCSSLEHESTYRAPN